MAYTAITSTEIQASKAIKQELWQKVKDNFDNHETRIGTLEASLSNFRPIEFVLVGYLGDIGAKTDIMIDRVNFNITLNAARLIQQTAGSSGTTEVDVLYKRGAGAFTSIFSTKPSLTSAAGNLAVSTNAVLSTTALLAADFLRFDLTSVQVGAQGIVLQLEFEAT